ncbi:MAG: phage major capsid protein [Clostridia bacterium]|nr:phage major capsid protein [Clostridia bacterium]MBQ8637455.1 phage major capsid protein [Clostridia bacterium]
MSQNLITFEKALKENYLPAWRNQLGTEPSALLGKIKKPTLKSNKIVASAPVGLSGGFGYGAEGQATPAAGGVRVERFETTAKDMYVNVVISEKAVKLTGSGGAMANALDTEVKGAYETAKWNIGRSLFGNGTGILTTISALTSAGNTITVADTAYLKEGLIIDIYKTGGMTPAVAGRRLLSVDRANNTITIGGDAVTVEAGFITVQNSYGREITGLGAIFDDSITSLYGVSKELNPFLKPIVHDGGNDIDDGIITKALRQAKNDKNSNIDMILCGDDAYDNYVNYLRVNNIRVEELSHTIQGGFKAIQFIFGNKVVDIVNESFVPATEMWGVETGCLELHSLDWNFAELQNGGIFNLMENQSCYRALLANYGDLICTNPGGCVRITNCA